MIKTGYLLFLLLIFYSATYGCANQKILHPSPKIGFDINALDKEGLVGEPGGKVAIDYEFCIPAHVNTARQVMSIDPTAIVYKESSGRLQCGKEQYLVVGDTYQANYLVTLKKLVELEYATRIQEAFFE